MQNRHVIFALLGVVVIGTMLWQPQLPISTSDATREVYDLIESLDSGSVVMMSFDHEASSLPEVRPLGAALADHCFRRGLRIVGLALFAEGTAAGSELLGERASMARRSYGTDWIYLGFRPQYTAAILGMGESIHDVFAIEYVEEQDLRSFPLGDAIEDYDDIDLVISIADGSMPTYWVEFAYARYGQTVATGLSAVMVTSFLPYWESGQLAGIVAGLRGAAGYEQLLSTPGAGSRGIGAVSSAHGLIALLVILGNWQAWRSRRRMGGR